MKPYYINEETNNKYRNSKVTFRGIEFDSQKEANRYGELLLLERGGMISDLQRQVKYILIPAQYEERNGKRICVERECSYYADFVYCRDGTTVVEDTKSEATKTKDYIIKRKLMLYVHGIRISEI